MTGEIEIYFIGICTHLQGVVDGIPHRVLLVHEQSDVVINGYRISSHKPLLNAPSPRLTTTPQRTILTIDNAIGAPPSYDGSYRCGIFRLQDVAGQKLELNRGIAVDKQSPASIYFDFQHGEFSAGEVPRNATAVRVVVKTSGSPVLKMTPMDAGEPELHDLPSGSRLILRNDALGPSAHQDADFLLHYRAVTVTPPGDRFPTRLPDCRPPLPALPIPEVELGPGCSNSNYP